MRTARIAFVALLALACAPALLAKIIVNHDQEANFSKYESWAFLKGTPATSELSQGRIEGIIEEELAAKGMKRVESDPDFYVVTHAATSAGQRIYADTYDYHGRRYHSGWGTTTVNIVNYTEGTLTIDIVDAGTKDLVWRGLGTDTLGKKPEKNAKKARKIIRKLFRQFPPQ